MFAQRHTQTAIFAPPFFAFSPRFSTRSFCIFARAPGRTEYAPFRVVRPLSHPLGSKAPRRPRPYPFRNCARFLVFLPFSHPLSTKAHRSPPPPHCAHFRTRSAPNRTADLCRRSLKCVCLCTSSLEVGITSICPCNPSPKMNLARTRNRKFKNYQKQGSFLGD